MLTKLFQRKTTKSRRGVLSLDTAFGVAIIIFLTTYVQAKSAPLAAKSDESLLIDGITHIIEGASNYKSGATDGYASMTMTALSDGGYVPAGFSTATGNPVGGAYAIGSASATAFSVTASGVSADVCARVAAKMGRFAIASCDDSTGTVSVIVGNPT
tara:strand:- start:1434 stop:1904 length:471 start_codon:yes stop_codon:yes gene_type:complete